MTKILGGDFKAKHKKWNSKIANTKGRTITKYADRHTYQVMGPGNPKHVGTGTEEITINLGQTLQIYTTTELKERKPITQTNKTISWNKYQTTIINISRPITIIKDLIQ